MLTGRHKRQVLLFLITVRVPAAPATGLVARIMNQDRGFTVKQGSISGVLPWINCAAS